MGSLRSYYYRDDTQVSEFLEQILDGNVSETAVKREGQRSKGGRLGLRGVAEANLGSTTTNSESFNLASTPVSRASQLEAWLGDQVAPLGPMDTEAFAQVQRGEFIRFEGVLAVPQVVRMAYVAAALGELASLAATIGRTLDGAEEVVAQADAVKHLIALDGFPIVAQHRSGGPGIMFIARLDRFVAEPISLHDQDLTVFGRVKRTIAAGRKLTQAEVLPNLSEHLPQPSREQRRAQGPKVQPVVLAGPAVLVETIAIYS